MSVSVYIDGRPVECREDYNEVIAQLVIVPDGSRNRFELWTTRQWCGRVTSRSVWLNPASDSSRAEWLADGGATLQSSNAEDGTEGCLWRGNSCINVRSAVATPIMPVLLAAFLAHDFPLVDAVMLARGRGAGWPNYLSDHPVPVGGPTSHVPFPKFPCCAGLYAVVPTSDRVHCLSQLSVPVVQLRYKGEEATLRAIEVRKAVDAISGSEPTTRQQAGN